MGKTPQLCKECSMKLSPTFHSFYVDNIPAVSIYNYDDNIKSLLYQFKGCYDIMLKDIFLYNYKEYLSVLYNDYLMLCAPSYIKEDLIRGFNHVEEMFSSLKLKKIKVFIKSENIKQSSNNFEKRKDIKNIIKMSDIKLEKNQRILLVDDIYTTGSTMRAMISLVKRFKPKEIKVLVMAKTKL